MALTDGLISWWDLDQDATTVNDQHGSNDLTENGSVTVSTGDGPGGQDVSTFNDVNDYLTRSTTPLTDYHDTWSLSVWALADSFSSTASTIINHRISAGAITYFWLFFRGADSDRITMRMWDGSTAFVDVAQTATPSTGTWYHVVVTHDGKGVGDTGLELFVDGSSNDTGNTNSLGSADTGSANFRVGSRWDAANNNQLPGDVAMLGIWDRVLTSGEISTLYNSGNGLQYDELDSGVIVARNRLAAIEHGQPIVTASGLNGDLIG